jgi:PelA/Pel-15E family pectate lyase
MELYNEYKKYSHEDINNLLSDDLTCIFKLMIFTDVNYNFKLIDKGEKGELFVILDKQKKLIFYYGNKIKKQIESSVLELNKQYHITFIRSLNSGKNYLYINGKIDNVSEIFNQDGLEITDNKIKFLNGGNDYKMNKIKICNYAMSLRQVKMNHLYDMKNKANLLKFISNRLDETMEISTGVYSGFLIEDMLILFTKCQMFICQKNYPVDTYVKYNMEQHEFSIPQILNMLALHTSDLGEKFNTDDFVNNLITWQVGMFETTYPKNIRNKKNKEVDGYWIEKEVSPFIPFTGKGLTYVTSDGKMSENKGTFQSGMFVSFLKLIVDKYLKTKDSDLLTSIDKTIDYIIAISEKNENGGVPLYFPELDNDEWKYNISMKNGNYINYLRTIEIILNSDDLINSLKLNLNLRNTDIKIEKLKKAYKKTLNLLLKLQINVNDVKTIWSQYYDKDTLSPVSGNSNEPIGLCSLESAQILLYLMDFESPTNNIKNAIISGCDWFKNNKITGWIQVFEKKSYDPSEQDVMTEQQTMLISYDYTPFPNKMTMHSRYYDFEKMKPIFQENNEIFTLKTFNNMSVEYRNSEFHIGMWGHYLLETYEEWKKIHLISQN